MLLVGIDVCQSWHALLYDGGPANTPPSSSLVVDASWRMSQCGHGSFDIGLEMILRPYSSNSVLHGKLYPCIKHFKYAGISMVNKLRKENSLFPVLSLVQVSKNPTLLHRSRMDILSDILQVAKEGARKTEIMHQCNLSFKQLCTYLDLLVSMGLLKSTPPEPGEKRNSNTYETTGKGRAFIQAYRNLTVLLAS